MRKQKSFWKNLNRILSSTLFVLVVIMGLRTFVFDWSVVPSGSMSKTFLTGDVVINSKLAYGYYSLCSIPIIGVRFGKRKFIELPRVKRGDIIVFCGKKDYITKRVIGLPGDVIRWDNIDLLINGESTMFHRDGSYLYPMEKYTLTKNHHDFNINEEMTLRMSRIPISAGKYLKINTLHSDQYEPHSQLVYKVPAGHVFVVGDNRYPRYSWDSRDHYYGDVPMSQITGKIVFRLFGSNAKVFNRERSLIANVIMFPYLILRYLAGLDFTRFGRIGDETITVLQTDTK